MSDLFHKDVSDEYIIRVARVMETANWHTYQVLTKRADRMAALLAGKLGFAAILPHIWWGVSVENRKHGLPRMEALRRGPAIVRFLSCEPLLEDLGDFDLTGIHWVIAGGESGPGARVMDVKWVRRIRSLCRKQRVPFFFKQWGGVRKHLTGRELDGRTWDEFPASGQKPSMPIGIRRQLLAAIELTGDFTEELPLYRACPKSASFAIASSSMKNGIT
jgi:protein gp37